MRIKKKNKIWIYIIFFSAIILFLIFLLLFTIADRGKNKNIGNQTVEYKKVHLFQKLPDFVLSDEAGNKINPLKNNKEVSVFLFWASWCSHCVDGVQEIDSLAQTAREMGVQFFLVDKLDGEKETKEQALEILREKRVDTKTFFDEECTAYESIGLNMIPTILIVNSNNQIVSMTEGSVPPKEQLRNMILEAQVGKSTSFLEKIIPVLMNDEGGIRTNYISVGDDIPSGDDVLSESQGILMEYAALAGDEGLFLKLWNYTKKELFSEGLMPWVISTKTNTNVNALVDDLRIIGAMETARNILDDEGDIYKQYIDTIYTWNTKEDRLVDFYDVETEQKADRFTLCYGDLITLSQMKKTDKRFKDVYNNTLDLMLAGKISEKFPLYHSYYDYTEEKYKGDRLNMAEEMTTLLHLAEVGELPKEALDWIANEMEKGCVYAAYDLEGNPAQDGYYESTSVYALIVMTALLERREDIAGRAINRMEQFRITDEESQLNGLFGNNDGTGIYSFDQGMALLAYELYERITG